MTFSLFSVAILSIAAVIMIKEIRKGFKGGFVKSLMSFTTLVLSLITSLILSPYISESIGSEFSYIIRDLIGNNSAISQSDCMRIFLNALSSIIISSFFFLTILAVMRAIFSFFSSRIYNKVNNTESELVEIEESENKISYMGESRKWGAFVGAVTGLLMTIIITSPIMGTLNVAKDIVAFVERADKTIVADEEVKAEVDALRSYANDSVGMVLYNMGGNIIYNSAASTTVRGETVYLVNEIKNMRLILEDFLEVYYIFQTPQNATPAHTENITRLCEYIEELRLCDIIIADYLPQAAQAWLGGNTFLGIHKPALNDVIVPAFDSILEVCSYTNIYTVKQDTITLIKIYALLIESGILENADNFSALIACIDEYDLLMKLNSELDKNPNMMPAKKEINRIAMTIISDRIHSDVYNSSKYNELTSSLADAINSITAKGYGTYEEELDAMTEYTLEYLKDYGIGVPNSVAEPIADIMLQGLSSGGTISSDQVENFLKNYLS